MVFNLTAQVQKYINAMAEQGTLTRTFRRLDYPRQLTILKSVLAEALESGPSSINIKSVARRAGVSVGSLYQYFGNRERMLECVFELSVNVSRDFCVVLSPALVDQPMSQALENYVQQVIEIGKAEPALVTLWSKAAYEGDQAISIRWVRPISSAIRGMLRTILMSARDKGELRADIDIEAATAVLDALTAAFFDSIFHPSINTLYGMSRPDADPVADWSRISDIFLQGVARSNDVHFKQDKRGLK